MTTDLTAINVASPGDLAEVLPFLLGHHPDNSAVAVGLDASTNRMGAAVRVDLPADPAEWDEFANAFIPVFLDLSQRNGVATTAVVVYVCPSRQDARSGYDSMRHHRALADQLAAASKRHDLKVIDSLFVTATHWWSYACTDPTCCSPQGMPARNRDFPGPVTTGAVFAGIPVPSSRAELLAALEPVTGPDAIAQRNALNRALDRAAGRLEQASARTGEEATARIVGLLDGLLGQDGGITLPELDDDVAADVIVAVRHKALRDIAAQYIEPDELPRAQDLWRQLARRCVDPYRRFATAPLTLLGLTAWAANDEVTARIALHGAHEIDPGGMLAKLCLAGLNDHRSFDVLIGETLRQERARRRGNSAP